LLKQFSITIQLKFNQMMHMETLTLLSVQEHRIAIHPHFPW